MFSKRSFERIRKIIARKLTERQVEFHSFVLAPPLKVALKTRGPQAMDDEEILDMIRTQYEMRMDNPGFGIVIDNQEQTPQQTAELIAHHIAGGKAAQELNVL